MKGYDGVAEDATGVLHLVHVSQPSQDGPPQVLWRCSGKYTLIPPWMIHHDKPYNCLLCIEAGE